MNSLSCLRQKVFDLSVKHCSSLTESKHMQCYAQCMCKDSPVSTCPYCQSRD